MNTAEQWISYTGLFQNDKDDRDREAIIKQIQLDAWKQGMSDACHALHLRNENVLKASIAFIRDAKKSL